MLMIGEKECIYGESIRYIKETYTKSIYINKYTELK
jgi:hypothetical protein